MNDGTIPEMRPSGPPIAPTARPARVLVVDTGAHVGEAVRRALSATAHAVAATPDCDAAQQELERACYDVLVVEMTSSGESGRQLLASLRAQRAPIPVILLAAVPSVESAAEAVALGAFRYLFMPLRTDVLVEAIDAVMHAREVCGAAGQTRTSRGELERTFATALRSLYMAYQPIVEAETRQVIGYEALMRSSEPCLPSPPAVLDAAEKLGALHVLGRRVRSLVATQLAAAPDVRCMFVNLHAADLADPELLDPAAPLSAHSERVVLEITERASLETIVDLDGRISALRALGYRIAVDDLGAGYAGLSYFARLRPDIAKIDMSLVRGIDSDPVRQKVVLSLASLATVLGMQVVAEGVETSAERDAVVRLGCTYVQGYALARPGPAFPDAKWCELGV